MTTPTWGRTTSVLKGLVQEARPRQWYKQGVMLFGIVFSRNIGNIEMWRRLIVGIAAFTAIVGAVYILNDIVDIEEDRNHPEKQNRPMASGQVSIQEGTATSGILLVFGLAAGYFLGPLFLAVLCAYLIQNLTYSLVLKQIVLVDVIIVAIGFVFRAIAGVVAIGVVLSPWLIVCTFLLALVLALGKRRHEYNSMENHANVRPVLDEYTARTLDDLLLLVTATLLIAYTLYSFFRTDLTMMLTLPFAFFGVFRYHHLLLTSDVGRRPQLLLTDRHSVINALLWGIVTICVLYDVPEAFIQVVR